MRRFTLWSIAVLTLAVATKFSCAESALAVLGKDYAFPNRVEGLPAKLSDFPGLQINSFVTGDGVKLTYWEAGTGKPLIFLPGWTSNGAEYINVMYLLSQHYHVYVLDHRNQGLSQRVDYGNRIARFATDFKEFVDQLGLRSFDVCGHSMGSSVLSSYIDQYGSGAIHKAAFVDEPISITSRPWWTLDEKKQYGVLVANPADLVRMGTQFLMPQATAPNKADGPRFSNTGQSTPAFENSVGFASQVIKNDPAYMLKVLYDHGANDWHDVIFQKIHMPVAIFSGDISPNLASQQWAHSVLKGSTFYVFSKQEGGDHFLVFRNPAKFAHDLGEFLVE
jgi:pimeloyl-ACP methyl ester carboxylesterase